MWVWSVEVCTCCVHARGCMKMMYVCAYVWVGAGHIHSPHVKGREQPWVLVPVFHCVWNRVYYCLLLGLHISVDVAVSASHFYLRSARITNIWVTVFLSRFMYVLRIPVKFEDPRAGPHASVVSILPTEPSPWRWDFFFNSSSCQIIIWFSKVDCTRPVQGVRV